MRELVKAEAEGRDEADPVEPESSRRDEAGSDPVERMGLCIGLRWEYIEASSEDTACKGEMSWRSTQN